MQGGPNVGSAVYDRTSGTKDGPQACGTVLGLLPFIFSFKFIVGSFRFIVGLLHKYCQGESE